MTGDEEQMLERYIHDYLVKRNFIRSAQIFVEETNVDTRNRVEIDNPEGFLREWWSNYYEVYRARVQTNNRGLAESSSMAPNRMGDELQIIGPPEMERQRIGQSPNITAVQGQPTASSVHSVDLRSDLQRRHYEARAHIRPSASDASHQQMQVNNRSQQQNARVGRCSRGLREPVLVDSTPHGAINLRPAQLNAGNNSGVGPLPLQGWPLIGVGSGPVSSGMGSEILNNSNFLQQQQQIQALANYPQTSLMPTSSQLQGGSTSHLSNLKHLRGAERRTMELAAIKEVMLLSREREQQQEADERQKLHEDIREILRRANKSNAAGGERAVGFAEVDKQVDENVESYFSPSDENTEITSNALSSLQPLSLDSEKNEPKVFSFKEVGSIHASNSKITCCHFSSDGKFLASGGHEKKVLMWNLDNSVLTKMEKEHSQMITDIRFRPNSNDFATSSFDRTVLLWDATKSNKSPLKFEGHGEQVMSLDFNERTTNLLCSCDRNDEIRFWNLSYSKPRCICTFKGANKQVRFLPQSGLLLAAASGSTLNLIDVETYSILKKFEGHTKDIYSLCWDTNGNHIASVSEDSARVWSVQSGKCEQELNSNGNKFESCTFHPGYSHLLVIGSYQSLVLWNAKEKNKTATIHAHEGIISSLSHSPQTGMVASASHDQWVKFWE